MLDALKTLMESGLINESTRDAINEAWDAKLKEIKTEARAEIREELATRYEHDKEVMVKALDRMVAETLTAEIAKIKEGRNDVAKLKLQTVKEMRNAAKKFNDFATRALAEELAEFATDRKQSKEHVQKLERFVIKSLAEEISEFALDKKQLTDTRVKLVSEAKAQLAKLKEQFIARSGDAVSKIVSETLNHEITQLHGDIKKARENSFGRKIFEAFATEFTGTHLNDNAEVRNLREQVKKANKQLVESRREIAAKSKLVESKQRELKLVEERASRKNILSEMLSPLDKSKREVMSQLLESVQTGHLKAAYDKYLPAVLNNRTQPSVVKSRETLVESTGDKAAKVVSIDENSLNEIKRLAGLL